MKRKQIKMGSLLFVLLLCFSCTDEFLDVKRNQKILIPSTLEELQALLDNDQVMNYSPGLGVLASDDFYITDAGFQKLDELQQQVFLLNTKSTGIKETSDWNRPYQQIFYANVVLEGLENQTDRSEKYNEIKGAALFYRSYALFCLLQHFAPPYSSESRENPAVPVPLKSDINSPREVFTIEGAYDLIINDLIEAASVLPSLQAIRTRPSNAAAYSLLGRIYLIIGDYFKAEKSLETALDLHCFLLDYNNLSKNDARPFPTPYPMGAGNEEVIFYNRFINYAYFNSNNLEVKIADDLIDSYETSDLRRELYFSTQDSLTYNFRGSYSGIRRGDLFTGLTVDENYLNYAEACTRNDNLEKAIELINKLLEKRHKTDRYNDFYADSKTDVLRFILIERRKSLVGRGTRWFDIRRFIDDDLFFIDAKRSLNDQVFKFDKNDERIWLNLHNK